VKQRWFLGAAALLVLAVAVLAIGVSWLAPKSDEERTLRSLRRVDDFPLYVMRYTGDYGFKDSLLQRTGVRSPWCSRDLSPIAPWACTCFAGLSPAGDKAFGRNFDWTTDAALLLFTDPPDGYASVSTVDITYLGFTKSEPDAEQRHRLLHAPFMPFDGMNEQGLAVGMMAVDGTASRDPGKATIDDLEAIRLLLDYARDVEEAISLLKQYNIDFGGGPPVHYLVADAGGSAAVVEYVAGEMKVIRNAEPWQVATNFVLSQTNPQGAHSPCWRYNAAWLALEGRAGHLGLAEAMALLQQVSQGGDYGTRWSVVYGMTTGDVFIAMDGRYQHVLRFELPMEH
jgi:choloylglycine hydrolase